MWNLGIMKAREYAQSWALTEWDVAIFNDDTEIPPGWMLVVSDTMRRMGGIAACSGGKTTQPIKYGPDEFPGTGNRLAGWAFMLRGEQGLEADEDFAWWCGDDDLSMRARRNGGLVMVPGLEVPNFLADSTTVGALAEQSIKDIEYFVQKWGQRPW